MIFCTQENKASFIREKKVELPIVKCGVASPHSFLGITVNMFQKETPHKLGILLCSYSGDLFTVFCITTQCKCLFAFFSTFISSNLITNNG